MQEVYHCPKCGIKLVTYTESENSLKCEQCVFKMSFYDSQFDLYYDNWVYYSYIEQLPQIQNPIYEIVYQFTEKFVRNQSNINKTFEVLMMCYNNHNLL